VTKEYGQPPKSSKRKKELTQQEAIERLWYEGTLFWKLKGKQKEIYDHFTESTEDMSTCLISRRFGKSFTLCLIAIEMCIKNPESTVKYACPKQNQVEKTIGPIFRIILKDCPEEIKPEWKTQQKAWIFPNGSEIQIAGTDGNNADNLRGGAAHLCICDEAGFMDDLETVVYSILFPTTDTTDGKVLLASTPNDKDPNHEFHEHFVNPLEATGKLLKFTYKDSPMVDDKKMARIIARYPGGVNNIKFRCEYLCEIPNVSEASVIPEFAKVEEEIVKELDIPDHCDFYTSMDLGFKDLTVALFGYYDFKHSRLVILDEYVINGPEVKTNIIDKNVKLKEKLWFTNSMGEQDAYLRVMDNNNLMLVNELARDYGLTFIPTAKHGKEQVIDTVRMWIEQKRIIIHPRCKNLLYHVKYAQWQYTRAGTSTGKFKHLKGNDTAGLLTSHADALDALIYMVRNVHTYRNPFPENYGISITEDTHKRRVPRTKASDSVDLMRKIMNLKQKRENN
jgi:PBSX family phage terminase large subunit